MTQETMSYVDKLSFAHDALNQLHVIMGNLELLAEERPEEQLLTDARDAAIELHRLLRRTWGPSN